MKLKKFEDIDVPLGSWFSQYYDCMTLGKSIVWVAPIMYIWRDEEQWCEGISTLKDLYGDF